MFTAYKASSALFLVLTHVLTQHLAAAFYFLDKISSTSVQVTTSGGRHWKIGSRCAVLSRVPACDPCLPPTSASAKRETVADLLAFPSSMNCPTCHRSCCESELSGCMTCDVRYCKYDYWDCPCNPPSLLTHLPLHLFNNFRLDRFSGSA